MPTMNKMFDSTIDTDMFSMLEIGILVIIFNCRLTIISVHYAIADTVKET